MQQSAFETYSVKLPNGRVVRRELPIGAADREVRSAFADVYRGAGYEPALAAVQRPEPTPSDGSELRAYDPSWSEWIGDRVYDLGTAMGLTSTADRMRREAGQLPVVGDVLSFLNGTEDIGRGDYWTGTGEIGLAALGVIPGPGDASAAVLRGAAHQGSRRALEPVIDTAATLSRPAANDIRTIRSAVPTGAAEASSTSWRDLRAYAWTTRERLTGVQHPIDMTDDEIAYWVALGRQRGPLPDHD